MPLMLGPNSIGIAAYSMPWRCGFAGAGTPRACASPLRAGDLLDLAIDHGLATVELPLEMLADARPDALQRVRARAAAHGVGIVVDTPVIDEARLAQALPLAAALGARVVRVMLSTVLEGARHTVAGGWPAHLEAMIAILRRLRPLAERYELIIAPENHQDATGDELAYLCDAVGGDSIGITLDAVNPLAVAEDPLATARLLGRRIVNVHLKDYQLYPSAEGYRLVRCALGDGVLDLTGLFAILAEHAPHARCSIELAALHARHIRIYDEAWWQGFGPRDVRSLLPVLALVRRHGRPADADWRTPWEAGADAGRLDDYETSQVLQSIARLKQLADERLARAVTEE
ncbi:MAG: sugar phosphate isomerase/epimerase [Chloroflexi bacterium]|nr:sugar phosphate isomerase/epimerase [Chloroflexota bacterium]